MSAFDAAGGSELFNSKVVFRAPAAGAGVPIPQGAVCTTSRDLERALTRYQDVTGAVIIKADRNSGGSGNILCLTDPTVAARGALTSTRVSGPAERAEVVARTGLQPDHAPHGQVVVEVFHPHCRSVCIEIDGTDPALEPPRVVSVGEMRMEPVWNGFVMPAPALEPPTHAVLLEHALEPARAMGSFGFRGLVNIDAIVSPAGEVWFNEVNARLGGCTHLHHLARTLLGPGWQEHHVLVSRNDLPAPHGFAALAGTLSAEGLAFDPATRCGTVLVADNTALAGTVEYAVPAPDYDQARTLEKDLRTRCGGASEPPPLR